MVQNLTTLANHTHEARSPCQAALGRHRRSHRSRRARAARSSSRWAPSASPGTIYPVNPKYPTVLNIKCYPSLTELPEAPDIVVFSIRNPLIPEQMRLAVGRGARAAVIYDSGFAELGGDGAKLQDEIAAMAREAGMPVCGPNCMGILNPQARVTTYKQNVRDRRRSSAMSASCRRADRSASRCCPTCAASASASRCPPATRR